MKVRALQNGFYAGSRIRAGTEFEVPDGEKARWFAPADKTPKGDKPQQAKGDKNPQTLSQMAGDKPQTMAQVLGNGKGSSLA